MLADPFEGSGFIGGYYCGLRLRIYIAGINRYTVDCHRVWALEKPVLIIPLISGLVRSVGGDPPPDRQTRLLALI